MSKCMEGMVSMRFILNIDLKKFGGEHRIDAMNISMRRCISFNATLFTTCKGFQLMIRPGTMCFGQSI